MENTEKKDVWAILSAVDCQKYVKKKGSLSYLSWVWAWKLVKDRFPDATWKKRRFEGDKPYIFDENLGYLVETEVTIQGETIEMQLPIMDSTNKAQKHIESAYKVKEYVYTNGKNVFTGKYIDKPIEAATMFDINTAIMRCFVKNLAMFGLGINLYVGEDLPLVETDPDPKAEPTKEPEPTPPPTEWIPETFEAFHSRPANMKIVKSKLETEKWALKQTWDKDCKTGFHCVADDAQVKEYIALHLEHLTEKKLIPKELMPVVPVV